MTCPKCGTKLAKVTVRTRPEYGADVLKDTEQTDKIEIDQCLSCNGVWFDVKELDQYLSEKLLILDSPIKSDYLKINKKEGPCPRCGITLIKKTAPKGAGFKVDVCQKCEGVWLDNSELDQLEEKNISFWEKHTLIFRHFKELFK